MRTVFSSWWVVTIMFFGTMYLIVCLLYWFDHTCLVHILFVCGNSLIEHVFQIARIFWTWNLAPYLRNSIQNACASLYKIDVFNAFSTRVRPPLRRQRWSLFLLACVLWMLFWWRCRMPGDTSNTFFLCLCSCAKFVIVVVNELQHFADCHGCSGCSGYSFLCSSCFYEFYWFGLCQDRFPCVDYSFALVNFQRNPSSLSKTRGFLWTIVMWPCTNGVNRLMYSTIA